MKHELKIWPNYYLPVSFGTKTFEVRKNDRGFQAGDIVVLKAYCPEIKQYLDGWSKGEPYPDLIYKIGYVLPIDADRVVFSLLPLNKPPPEGSGE